MRNFWALCLAAACAFGFAGCAGCTPGNGTNTDGGGGGGGGGGGDNDSGTDPDGGGDPDGGDMTVCKPLGTACSGNDLCCQGVCNANGVCALMQTTCGAAGTACTDSTDCCTNRCENGQCSATQCVDNGAACTANSDCCTANCAGGTCAAIPGSSACKVEGQACAMGTECCSTNCQGGVCAAAYTCRAPNDLCFKDTDCCSLLCSKNDGSAGFCRLPSGGCTQDGVPCENSSNCCTRTCADPGTGATVCLPASGCKMTGAPCPDNQSCCGGGTNPNGTVTCEKAVSTDAYGRCDNGQSCNPVGNICGASFPTPDGGTFSVNASQNCCDGMKAVCKLDSSGIPRCFGGFSNQCPDGYTGQAPCCIALGDVCQFKDQCCNGAPCVPDQQGILRCTASTCTPLGESCTPGDGGTTCCSGECLPGELGNTCQIPTTLPDGGSSTTDGGTCKANNSACTSGSECCSQICDNGVCSVGTLCQGENNVCTTSADCCTGLGCVIPSGSTSGTCQKTTCASAGQSCSPTNSCCSGYTCLQNGTVQLCDGTTACTCNVVIN